MLVHRASPTMAPGATLFRRSPLAAFVAMTKADPQPDTNAPADDGLPPEASAADLQATVDALQGDLDLAKDRLVRARADYDNLQKRVSRDAAFERDRAKARVLEGLLPLYELCQTAAHQAKAHPLPAEAHGVVEGVVLLAREFRRTLEREGLTPVGAVGEPFDATLHEAVAEDAVEGVEPGCVSRVVQPGYRLGDKVLRFAKVAVAPKG